MKTIKLICIVALALIITNCSNKKPESEKSMNENIAEVVEEKVIEASLYQRLGEAEGIASIVDGIFEEHRNNPVLKDKLAYLFEDTEHMAVVKKHICDFLSTGTGGPENYTGKEFSVVHTGMKISEKEYLTTVDDILIALDKNNIDLETKKDMLFILYSLKGPVIGR